MDLADVPRETLAIAVLVAVTVAVGQLAYALLRRAGRRSGLRLRMQRARDGEARAARRLAQLGFTVLGEQVVAEHVVQVDDAQVTATLRADYLVTKGRRRYVVEVKTGALAPRIETSATRRQLLEYGVAFDVDGILLVDGDTCEVRAVSFPSLLRGRSAEAPRAWGAALPLLLAAMVAAVVWLAR
ncbi:MAG: hypothetical protein JWP97_6719 [Labilithrix sp.]|nr:hypothetical protein [Labilithrix sp.]